MPMRSVKVFVAAVLAACLGAVPCARAQRIAFTWDDLPAHSALPPGESRQHVAAQIIAAMQAAHMPAAFGFVNAVRVQEEPDTVQVLDAWRAAGLPLGNHSFSHMNLNQNALPDFEADVLSGEAILRREMGAEDWHWFRYPYLAEGDTPEKHAAARVFLAQHGYKVAAVTMSFGDYQWNEPYARCAQQGNSAAVASLEQSFLDAAARVLDDSHRKSFALFHRDIPYVLLMHVGAFDARMLPRLLALYRARGVTFITLQAAEQDDFYRIDTHLMSPVGPDTLEEALAARHLAPIPNGGSSFDFNAVCR